MFVSFQAVTDIINAIFSKVYSGSKKRAFKPAPFHILTVSAPSAVAPPALFIILPYVQAEKQQKQQKYAAEIKRRA
jgi:hypothetical protein